MKKKIYIALTALCLTTTPLSPMAQEAEGQFKVEPVYHAKQVAVEEAEMAVIPPAPESDSITEYMELPAEQEKKAVIPGSEPDSTTEYKAIPDEQENMAIIPTN